MVVQGVDFVFFVCVFFPDPRFVVLICCCYLFGVQGAVPFREYWVLEV